MRLPKFFSPEKGLFQAKILLAEMLKGGVIFHVTDADQAKIAEAAGAAAVMACQPLSSVAPPEDKTSRMPAPDFLRVIQKSVAIPVMVRCRIGHFVEAQILQALEIDFIDESEQLTSVDKDNSIDKHEFKTPFVFGCRDLTGALKRIEEGAAIIRTEYQIDCDAVASSVGSLRSISREIKELTCMDRAELVSVSELSAVPYELVEWVANNGRLPVPLFAAGGITTPADVALMMQLGAQSVYIDETFFNSKNPAKKARRIVEAVSFYQDPITLSEISME